MQGIRKARGLPPLNSIDMRRFLRETGTRRITQPDGSCAPEIRPIGPLPNLRRAIDAMLNAAPDRFEGNNSLGSATTRARNGWVHTQSTISPPRQVVDTWTMTLPDLTLSSVSDIDFFRIPLPDPANPAEGGRAELQECLIISGSGVLSESRTESRGELRVRVIPGNTPPPGEGIQLYRNDLRADGLGSGSLLEQTITCPRTRRDLREITFSVGERRAGARPLEGLRYTLQLEYRIVTTSYIPAWLDLVENIDVNVLLCEGVFPVCEGDLLGGKASFVTRHPYLLSECIASTCSELRYFVWPGGALDMTFVADGDLAFQLFDAAQKMVGQAQVGPVLAGTAIKPSDANSVTQVLKLDQLAAGVYVLRIDGPTAEYSVSFVPPTGQGDARKIHLPLIVH